MGRRGGRADNCTFLASARRLVEWNGGLRVAMR
jgi:hypothetical protein